MAYAIRYSWGGKDGDASAGGGFSSSYAGGDWTYPLLAAGATAVHTSGHVQRGGTLTAAADFVLLSDGSFYGPNGSRTLEEFQQNLASTRGEQQHVSSILQTEGSEALKRYLEKQLAQDPEDQKLMHPHLAGFTRASSSATIDPNGTQPAKQ